MPRGSRKQQFVGTNSRLSIGHLGLSWTSRKQSSGNRKSDHVFSRAKARGDVSRRGGPHALRSTSQRTYAASSASHLPPPPHAMPKTTVRSRIASLALVAAIAASSHVTVVSAKATPRRALLSSDATASSIAAISQAVADVTKTTAEAVVEIKKRVAEEMAAAEEADAPAPALEEEDPSPVGLNPLPGTVRRALLQVGTLNNLNAAVENVIDTTADDIVDAADRLYEDVEDAFLAPAPAPDALRRLLQSGDQGDAMAETFTGFSQSVADVVQTTADAVVDVANTVAEEIEDAMAPAPSEEDETETEAPPAVVAGTPGGSGKTLGARAIAAPVPGTKRRILLQAETFSETADDSFVQRIENEIAEIQLGPEEAPVGSMMDSPMGSMMDDMMYDEMDAAEAPAAGNRRLLQSDDSFVTRIENQINVVRQAAAPEEAPVVESIAPVVEVPIDSSYEMDDEMDAEAPVAGRRTLLQLYQDAMPPMADAPSYEQLDTEDAVDDYAFAMPDPLVVPEPAAMAPSPDLVKRRTLKQLDYVDYETLGAVDAALGAPAASSLAAAAAPRAATEASAPVA